MILDSSIANIRKRVKEDAKKRRVPKFIVSVVVRVFNFRVGNKLDKLKFSYLLRRIPTLIIQTKSDKATTYGMLMEEYNEIAQNKNVQLKVFERGSHTRIYAESDYKEEYTQAVADFLKGVAVNGVREETTNKNIQEEVAIKSGADENRNDKNSEYYEKFSDFDFDDNENE